jgi:hypothetical protein
VAPAPDPAECDGVEAPPDSLWERVRAEPGRAPEHIALAASERFAAPAERWAARERHRHSAAKVARLARRRHVRLSRLEGAVAGLGGAITVAPDMAALAWIQGRMVFFIAAAHDLDPGDPMRPAELLALQGVYASPAEARAALDGMGPSLAVQYVRTRSQRARERHLASGLVGLVGRAVARRTVLRAVPILSSPVASFGNARATGRLADRAIAFYAKAATDGGLERS